MRTLRTILISTQLSVCLLSGLSTAGVAIASPGVGDSHTVAAARVYHTELFGRKYRLNDSRDLAAYTRALEADMEQLEKSGGEDATVYPVRSNGAPRHTPDSAPSHPVDKKMRAALAETHEVAVALASATGPDRQRLLDDLYIMAGAIRASQMRLLPRDMDAFTALVHESELRRPPVGMGKSGPAVDLASTGDDASLLDPVAPSSYWNRPEHLAEQDLYYGFGRTRLPGLAGEVCTYVGPKSGLGVHGGFEIRCGRYKKAKIKFGKQYSQPVAQRLFRAMGFHTVPADYVPEVKVKWDERIFTEFNSRRDERFSVKLFGMIPVHTEHLQHYIDPFEPLSEVVMEDSDGKEVLIKPQPNWDAFKAQLFKNPNGRPELAKGNFNEAFASRIKYLIYRGVNLQLKNETEDEDEIVLGNWDWNGEGNPNLRETRGAAFLAAWLNGYDPSVANNRLTMLQTENGRTFKHYISDVGVCLGRADDAPRMEAQCPNAFPWTFTRPAHPGETAIPFNGSYHPIKRNRAFEAADISDARWSARLLAQLTQEQIVEALVASGMPSAYVRLYYNKLANRRNQALENLGLHYPELPLMDSSQQFDYDPRVDGPIAITTCQGETVTAPDEGWIVVKGKIVMRGQPHRD